MTISNMTANAGIVKVFSDLISAANQVESQPRVNSLGFEAADSSRQRVGAELLARDSSSWQSISTMVNNLSATAVNSLHGLLTNLISTVGAKRAQQIEASIKDTFIEGLQSGVTNVEVTAPNPAGIHGLSRLYGFNLTTHGIPKGEPNIEVPLRFDIEIKNGKKFSGIIITFASNNGTWSEDSIEMKRLVFPGDPAFPRPEFYLSKSGNSNEFVPINSSLPGLLAQQGISQKALNFILPKVKQAGGPFAKETT